MVQVYSRYVRYLLWEFRGPLVIFWSIVFGGGLIVHLTYHNNGEGLEFMEACYGIFLMIFVEGFLEFPDEWYLQIFFFLVPIVGLGAIAESLVRLGFLVFSRKGNLPEWHRMVASLERNHIVVVGLGKVGYRIVKELLHLRENVVVVEKVDANSPLIDEIIELGVPIVRGDGRAAKTLEMAGVPKARGVILATTDDLTNLDAGLVSRDLNPEARVVMRLFDESLARKVEGAFHIPAISTAQVSAPTYVAAATGRKVYQELRLAGERLHLVDLTISGEGSLVGHTVGQIQNDQHVNVVMHRGSEGVNVNPGHEIVFRPGDEILVIAPIEFLLELEAANETNREEGSGD